MFIDSAKVSVEAGKGGNGCRSFRREKYVERGGPDGGDGGDGGSVIFRGAINVNGLANFRNSKTLRAENGQSGSGVKCHGRRGESLVVHVPLGTVVYSESGELLADITKDGQEATVAQGGEGGFGNAHFVSSTRRAPQVAELGIPGEKKQLRLELKLIADVGLAGLPNAGKSTFLSVVSAARPKVADYPFTTLAPQLGVVDRFGSSITIADIPGLIEGASDGRGLGFDFLKHIERTAVVLHLVDGFSDDVKKDFLVINAELGSFSDLLSAKKRIIAVTKSELLDDEMQAKTLKQLKSVADGAEIFFISSVANQGLEELLKELFQAVDANQTSAEETNENSEETEDESEIPIFTAPEASFWVEKIDEKTFQIYGKDIERFALKTNEEDPFSEERLKDIMHKTGVWRELEMAGATVGSTFVIGGKRFDY